MSLFAIGDLHLALNPSFEKPMDVFGPAWENHAARVEENWRRLIAPEDTVIVAGDISWALKLEDAKQDLDFVAALPGQKVFIRGNHDLWWHGITKLNEMYDNIYFLQNTCYETEEAILCGSRGWIHPGIEGFDEDDEKIYKRELLRLEASLKAGALCREATGKEIVGILHYPPTNERFAATGFTELFEAYGVTQVVYGHLHGQDGFPKGPKGMHKGISYRLVSLDYIEAIPIQLA